MLPAECWSVVCAVVCGAFADVVVVANDVVLEDSGGELQVRVCGPAAWVVICDQVIDNVRGETVAPHNR